MKKFSFLFIAILAFSIFSLSGCDLIKNIFMGAKGIIEYEGLYYSPVEGGWCCEGDDYEYDGEHLIIPDTVNGKPVVALSNTSFIDSVKIKKVTLPDTIKSIGKAFKGCKNLNSINSDSANTVVMPRDLEDYWGIGGASYEQNFYYVTFPGKTVVSTEDLVGFINLRSLEIESLNCAVGEMFERVTSSNPVSYGRYEVKVYDGMDHGILGWSYDKYAVPNAFKTIKVRSGSLPISAFADTKLKNITLGDGVTSIGKLAFYDNEYIENIKINASPSLYSFRNCTALTTVEFGPGVTSISNGAFLDCSNLSQIKFGSDVSISTIGESAFSGCVKLSKFNEIGTLPNGIVSIGDSAFLNCKALRGITLPSTCKTIGNNAFMNCETLLEINMYAEEIGNSCFENCTQLERVYFNDKIETIGERSFAKCTAMYEIYLPNSLNTIKAAQAFNSPFFDCSSTLKLYVEDILPLPSKFSSFWNNYAVDNLSGKLTVIYDADLSDLNSYA